ncbi:MAG: polymer-forming cytoskeletal protein [Nitrospira sp.]|nr:polymer-forming cytoskeletal protein [Nitrospira sp.]MDH4370352.1 polymer-forming cytoskeletal protein [Nitrospira sp.]MDH5336022.1 polymer-forming cytoskeletal protein [Nitrospira sp.]MDH5497426.1 polymer-forming cytoskeletal protein [Nitrospira sp.]MDH5724438.1 polymer-forming cytoskeletal protein [Nitrospira sp.]
MWALGEKQAQDAGDSENFTFLAKGVDFKGIVSFDGTIRIDGRVEGEVHTTGTLIVGEQATVKGIISAGTLMTSGKINGTVTATAKIQIQKHGVLIGDIRTPGISIEDGAHFHGMCDMGAHKWVEEQPASPKYPHDLTGHRSKMRASDL